MNKKTRANVVWLFDAAYDEIDSEGFATKGASSPFEGPCGVGDALIRVAQRSGRIPFLRAAMGLVEDVTGMEFWRWDKRQTDEVRVLEFLERMADTYRGKQ